MADEHHVVRSVSWNEVFRFSNIFKTWKMAIHPGKIILALLAIALTCVVGRVMDPLWSGVSDSAVVMPGEAWTCWRAPSRAAFLEEKERWVEETRVTGLAAMLRGLPDVKDADKLAKDDFGKGVGKVEKGLAKRYEEAKENAEKQWEKREDEIEKNPSKKERKKLTEQADKARLQTEQRALQEYIAASKNLKQWEGAGIFGGFLDWQGRCVSNVIGAVRRGNIATGLTDLLNRRGSMTPGALKTPAVPNSTPFDASTNDPEGYGVLAWFVMMGWGLWWMASAYPIYSLIFIAIALAIWSVLGGAICRIAAMHAAREEKISMATAVKFSLSKFLGFFTAPLLPLGIIVLLGLFLALGGLVGTIPVIGEWIVAVLFFLAVILGVVIAFLAVGLVGGAPLMWPTIAVEGSDSFDAISRSFSYIFARPFRYGLYWLVAAVYGTICYLFVRLFAFVGLRAVHFWTGWAMKLAGREQYADGAGKLDVMWAQPTFESFHGPFQFEAMSGSEAGASVVLSLWVYLVAGAVMAFGVCFVLSAATNIYYILRQKVDATDLDDVYVEEAAEEAAIEGAIEEAVVEEAIEEAAEEEPAEGEDETGKKKSK